LVEVIIGPFTGVAMGALRARSPYETKNALKPAEPNQLLI